ncbi:ATP-binding protein [uncultured Boseongicola sp.]|uniref:ATP-binding protein n=1 Tax=uncultured Boseongicola sp. TaxID=1648499 RepID=UPI002604C056|nr:ATP-binding protein [uncultured Boseongicola sp.]
MIGQFLKQFMPRSLFGRATLILLVPVGTILLVMSIVFIQRLYEDVTRQMTEGVANEIVLILSRVDASETPESALIAAREIAAPLGLEVSFLDRPSVEPRVGLDLSGRTVTATLREQVAGIDTVDLTSRKGFALIAINSVHGAVLLEIPRTRLSARNPHQFLVLIGVTSALMVMIALLYLRGQVRPIRRLAAAASAFGKGRSVAFRPAGAAEVREAGNAFIQMRDRIEHQIEQRTLLLSGVSHDLRTPLTRLRLAISMSDSPENDDMVRDVDEMQQMLDAFLDFARSESLGEPERIDPTPLIHDAVNKAVRAGGAVSLGEMAKTDPITLRAPAFDRAIGNLIGNAIKYGSKARVSLTLSEQFVSISVEDDGPGIPSELREAALKPFTRLDQSRNQDAGSGVGLGLAIAGDIARQHGGSIVLSDSADLGGLHAAIVLPR